MRLFCKTLGMNSGAGQALTLIISVILCLSSFARDSQAYTGFCEGGDGSSICCSEDADCGQGGICVLKRGTCFGGIPCNSSSECEYAGCLSWGQCMGGEQDGSPCVVVIGVCSFPFFPTLCNSSLDCVFNGMTWPCIPVPDILPCPGGTCVPCVEGCAIATVTLGTELEGKTDVLRAFRDKYLVSNSVGKAFINAYYKYSPPVADYIAEREWLKNVVRILLKPVVGLVSLFV